MFLLIALLGTRRHLLRAGLWAEVLEAIEPALYSIPLYVQRWGAVVYGNDYSGDALNFYCVVFCHPRLNVSVAGQVIPLPDSSLLAPFLPHFPVTQNLT